MALSEGFIITCTMILLRNLWGYMYSNEAEVVKYIARSHDILFHDFYCVSREYRSVTLIENTTSKSNLKSCKFWITGCGSRFVLFFSNSGTGEPKLR
uniref:Uncharacterized protein n=1 Tax=Oryza rufipogon TaxID=4529 RepID=A0A0E0QXY0_ORYRU